VTPLTIDGTTFYALAEVAGEARVSRQTIWRWRQEGKIPAGHVYRDRRVVFSDSETRAVLEYANRLAPVSGIARGQLSLFTDEAHGRGSHEHKA
jgi:predicted DNA-binding transcriptional regulator AlpA